MKDLVSQQLVQYREYRGIRHVFGLGGHMNIAVLSALGKSAIADHDQATVDRAIQAVGWATANEKTFTRISRQGIEESGLGNRGNRPNKRFKIMGILRDALR